MNTNILIVEDEKNLGQTLFDYLESKGFSSKLASTYQEALAYFLKNLPDIGLIDIGLPDGSGLNLAREMRKLRPEFCVIFLSALNDPDTRVQGLEIGAEDYITKPFALKELMLRLERINGRKVNWANQSSEIQIGSLKIWFSKYEIADANGKIIPLSQKECAILDLLYKKRGEVVTRDSIIENIWGEEAFPSTRTVDNYIVKLRRWCESDPKKLLEIMSIRGAGYKLIIN